MAPCRRQYPVPQKAWDNGIFIPASIIALSLLAAICVIVFWLWPDPVAPPERDIFDKLTPPIAYEMPTVGPSPTIEPHSVPEPKGSIVIEK
jgi:hypothetical protein